MTDPQDQQPVTPPPAAPTPPPAGETPAYAAPAGPLTAEGDKSLAMWAHIGGVVGFLPSLIIWLVFKDRGPRTAVEGKEALNWQITFTIAYVAAFVVSSILSTVLPFLFFVWGLLPLAVWIVNVVFSIQGGLKVNAGGSYQYPVNFRFIK